MNYSTDRHITLDFLRGSCAIAVVLYHFLSWRFNFAIESMGSFPVYIFFTLSALTMIMVYHKDIQTGFDIAFLRKFYINRIARLMPLLILISILMATLALLRHEPVATTLFFAAATATSLTGLHMPGFLSTGVGAWSLGIEFVFYLLFPVSAIFVLNTSKTKILFVFIFALLMQHGLLEVIKEFNKKDFWVFYVMPLTFAPFFIMGYLIFQTKIQKNSIYFYICCLLLVFICNFSNIFELNIYTNHSAYLFLTLVSGLIVLTAFCSNPPKLLHRTSIFIGEISYALYLTHWFSYSITTKLDSKFYSGSNQEIYFTLSFIIISLALASITYWCFEKPARKHIRSYFSK